MFAILFYDFIFYPFAVYGKTVNYSMEFQRIYNTFFGRGCRQMLCLLFHMTSKQLLSVTQWDVFYWKLADGARPKD